MAAMIASVPAVAFSAPVRETRRTATKAAIPARVNRAVQLSAKASMAGARVQTTAARATVARAAVVSVSAVYAKPQTKYADELLETVTKMTMPGKGILAMDESSPTCGGRLEALGIENVVENRRRYRDLLLSTEGLGEHCGGAILFDETLYQSATDGRTFVEVLKSHGMYPGIKVDTGLRPLANSNGEQWCQGLDGLAERCAAYYTAGARFCKWRTVVSIPAGPTEQAVKEVANGLARYGAIAQMNGLVPIIEPEILLDGTHTIEQNFEVASWVWAETFKAMMDQGVMLDRIMLKPSMVAPGADCETKASAEQVAALTLKMLHSRVPPSVPGIMFLSGGLSELDSTLYLNAMNQQPNPWHVSFSYARALQNTVLKTWAGKDENKAAAQAILIRRAKENGAAQLGKFDVTKSETEGASMYVKGYVY